MIKMRIIIAAGVIVVISPRLIEIRLIIKLPAAALSIIISGLSVPGILIVLIIALLSPVPNIFLLITEAILIII